MQYKISIEKIEQVEYPELKRVYIDNETHKEYDSKYDLPDKVYNDSKLYSYLDRPNGRKLIRENKDVIYTRLTDKELDIKKVIDAFNQQGE